MKEVFASPLHRLRLFCIQHTFHFKLKILEYFLLSILIGIDESKDTIQTTSKILDEKKWNGIKCS